jgi:hypothetical protein
MALDVSDRVEGGRPGAQERNTPCLRIPEHDSPNLADIGREFCTFGFYARRLLGVGGSIVNELQGHILHSAEVQEVAHTLRQVQGFSQNAQGLGFRQMT